MQRVRRSPRCWRVAGTALAVAGIVFSLTAGASATPAPLVASSSPYCGSGGAFSVNGSTATCTYSAAGTDTFTVPGGVSSVTVEAIGGKGGNTASGCSFYAPSASVGGSGADATGAAAVTAGDTLTVKVASNGGNASCSGAGGAGGSGGGGAGGRGLGTDLAGAPGGGGGGGASAVLDGGTTLIVAGGGGGAGSGYGSPGAGTTAGGSAGVDSSSENGNPGSSPGSGSGGGGGTQSAGGAAGADDVSGGYYGNPNYPGSGGSFSGGVGGDWENYSGGPGGGGGSGYFGGGGGGIGSYGNGGGGGSSYVTGLTNESVTYDSTHVPLVKVSWTPVPPTAVISSPSSGGTYNLGATVATTFSCTDGSGNGISTCLDGNGADSGTGGTLDTSAAGAKTYTVTATSTDGEIGVSSITYTVVGPPTESITTPADGAYYATGEVVNASFSCTEAANGPGISSCDGTAASGSAIDTSTPGSHSFTVTATSSDGQTSNHTVNYTVADPPTAQIASPAGGGVYNLGDTVSTSFSCTEGASGPGIATCADSNGAGGGSGALDTSVAGVNETYTVTATSSDGQQTTTSIQYTVLGPPTAQVTTPADGAYYAVGQAVDSSFSCTEAANGPGINSCLDPNSNSSGEPVDTSTPGVYAYTVTALSGDGQTGTATVHYTVAAAPTASVDSPAGGATYGVGRVVATTFSCSEGASGPGISSCADSNGATGGTGALDTTTTGPHTYTVTATSSDGQTGQASISYTVAADPSASITAPADGAYYTVGQVVDTDFSCTDGQFGTGIAGCIGDAADGVAIDTSTPGQYSFSVGAFSFDGQHTTTTVHYTVAGPPLGQITAPVDGAYYHVGQLVNADFSCSEGPSGPGIASCDGTALAGDPIDTTTPGRYTFTLIATSGDGQAAITTVAYTVAAAPKVSIAAPVANRYYSLGQVVNAGFSCSEGADGPGLTSCIGTRSVGTAIPTGTLGAHTFTVTATSSDGQVTTKTVRYTVAAAPTAAIAAPVTGRTYALGQVVATSFHCADGAYGPGISSCRDSNGATGGSGHLATKSLGRHTYTVVARSKDGQTRTKSITYTVAAKPTVTLTAPAGGKSYKKGSTVRAKFSCRDGSYGPGISSCKGTVKNGTAINTSTLGKHTFTVTAVSKDGQRTVKTVTYTVVKP